MAGWKNWRPHFSGRNFPSIFVASEADADRHTIRSHGAQIARKHMHDWIILVLLAVLEVILFSIHPFYRFVGKDMMTDLKYPLKGNTVPIWSVPFCCLLLSFFSFIFVGGTSMICITAFWLSVNKTKEFLPWFARAGLLFAILITAVITDAIKDAVGRPRPDFFWRCFSNGTEAYDRWGDVICNGDPAVIKEGHKSFPSGHTSWSFAGLGFLSLYLSGKIKAFNHKGHVAKLCIVFLPLLLAALVGVSRVDDYWHHWQDVFTGGLIGLVVATFCYLQFFPLPYNDEGWGPYAYFRARQELLARANTGQPALTVEVEQVQEPSLLPGRNGEIDMAPLTTGGSVQRSEFEDIEMGKK